MTTEIAVKIFTIAAIFLCGMTFLLTCLQSKRPALIAFMIAWNANLVVFVLNWTIAGEPPFGNMYHVMIAISLGFLPLYFVLKLRDRMDWLLAYFSVPPIILLLGSLFMHADMHWQRMPALRSIWFVPHVASYVLSYSLSAVAFVLSMVLIVPGLKLEQDRSEYEDAIHRIVLLAFPLMTFGLLSGAIWAEEAWGSYWSWDVKETWALITWLLYLIYLHCFRSKVFRKWAVIAQILAFIALIVTFLVVNYGLIPQLRSVLHAYA